MYFLNNKIFMQQAIDLAKQAYKANEVPIGAVIVDKYDQIIASNYNKVIQNNDPTAHAEILAIKDACNHYGSKYLHNCRIYVTLEPCLMCIGAIIECQLEFIYYGAIDSRYNSIKMLEFYNHDIQYCGGICSEESSRLLKQFFVQLRKIKNK